MADSKPNKVKDAPGKTGETVNLDAIADAIAAEDHASIKEDDVADAVASDTSDEDQAKPAPMASPAPSPAPSPKPTKKNAGRTAAASAKSPKPAPVRDDATDRAEPSASVAQQQFKPTTPEEKPMATNSDTATQFTDTATNVAEDAQSRMKNVYEKGTAMSSEAVDFQKGNVEAMVESSRIFVSGMQDMGRTYVEEARSAAETMQDDVKKMAAVKSPTELFQLQGEIARRNFDAMVAAASKNTESMIKLANEAFAPMSNRMSLAAEKVSKAA